MTEHAEVLMLQGIRQWKTERAATRSAANAPEPTPEPPPSKPAPARAASPGEALVLAKHGGFPVERRAKRREVLQVVEEHYGVTWEQLSQRTHEAAYVARRRMAFHLLRTETGASKLEIARTFGVHHTTVIHHLRQIETSLQRDPRLAALVQQLKDRLWQITLRERAA